MVTVAHGEGRNGSGRRPVLAVFLDGLGADAIQRMPFLASQQTVRRIRTELGYSITCHASMYTGLRPDRHGLWFVWQRHPSESPFKWLRPLRFLDRIDNLPMHVAATKITRRFVRTSSWFGIPYPVHVPWRDLPNLDVTERKLWNEPGYLAPVETVFDRMRAAKVQFNIVGMMKGERSGLRAIEAWSPLADASALTYLFAGDIDHLSHAHGQGSPQVTSLLGRIDRIIQRHMQSLVNAGVDPALLVWSDHGHHDVRRLNPLTFLAQRNFDLTRYPHVIDTNFIRLWVDDAVERMNVVSQLNGLGIGRVLTVDDLESYHVKMPHDRYGNVIFYVDLPWALTHTIWGFGRRLASAHGYLPDYPGSDGVMVSNMPARAGHVDLVDIAPSLLQLVGVPEPDTLDGRSVWSNG